MVSPSLIRSVETIPVRAPMGKARGPSILDYRARESLFVKITTEDGVVGWGETYLGAGVESTTREVLAPMLVGRDPLDQRRLRQQMLAATFENGFAVGGIDIALHDLAGKLLGVPVHALYGGAVRTRLPVYASLPGYHEDIGPEKHWVDEAADLVDRGFRAMKLRIGRFAPERELPIIGEVSRSLPDDARLMVDGNAAYTAPTAVRVARALFDLGLGWFEEPLPQFGYAGYPELRKKFEIALAGGEGLTTRHQAASLLERGCFDIIQPDVSICGGIPEVLFIADLARLRGVQCIPHCWGGAIMLAATAHIVSLLPDPSRLPGNDSPRVEYDVTENPFRTEVVSSEVFAVEDGFINLPAGPGLGIEIDQEVLQHYSI